MNKTMKTMAVLVLILCLTIGISACGSSTETDSLQKKNKSWLSSADNATLGYNFSMQENLEWGMTLKEVSEIIEGPFEDDYETYLSMWKSGALPTSDKWKKDADSVNADDFKESDILCFYTFSEDSKLMEYGYQHYGASLYQYDFLKEYYTKKYGKAAKEEFIWNDETYKPDGTEDLYKMFQEGQVKVLTVWDLDELGSVLVVDWLNDPAKKTNNFGQVSFYEKTAELNLEDESTSGSGISGSAVEGSEGE